MTDEIEEFTSAAGPIIFGRPTTVVGDILGRSRKPILVETRARIICAARDAGMTYAAIGRCMRRDKATIRGIYRTQKRGRK